MREISMKTLSAKTLSASLLALALATGAGYAQLSSVTDATARTTQNTRLDTVRPGELQSRTDVSGHARQQICQLN